MVRTIKEIQDAIHADLVAKGIILSTSTVAEWRLWTYVVAVVIHSFEVILNQFRDEIDALTNKITPGTVRWYAEMCYRFQNGHELLFDNKTAMLHYADDVESARIIKVVAITEGVNKLFIKAAKINSEGKIVPLSEDERYNFTGYIDAIKFAGVETDVISTTEDKIKYDMQIYYDPAIPVTIVRDNIHKSLDAFKTAIGFDSMLYLQKMLDVVMDVPGVITINLNSISRKGATDATFIDFNVFSELASGYFDYDGDCNLVLTSIKDLR